MSFLDLATKRYSARGYKLDPVEESKLEKILHAATIAPTAANKQPFQIIVIHTAGKKEQLKQFYDRDWFVAAPVILCVCAIPSEAWTRSDGVNYSIVDAAIVMDHITLAATDLELGTCWIGAFNPEAARAFLGLPDNIEPIAFTPVGYPTDTPSARHSQRKSVAQLVRYEHW